ncbi:hypothetical protein MTO96_028763 [Rhipicephalus appendiculatus]
MSFSRETVGCVLILCIGINFFCIGSYVFGKYRTLGNTGWIFDILLGLETGVNLLSDFTLLSALQTSAVVVTKLRNFLSLNTGTILFCCVTHIGASYYVAQYVDVDGAFSAEEEQSVRNIVFAQLALFYVFLLTVKGAILYNIYGYYRDFKDQPPPINAIFVINPVADQGTARCFRQRESTTATRSRFGESNTTTRSRCGESATTTKSRCCESTEHHIEPSRRIGIRN